MRRRAPANGRCWRASPSSRRSASSNAEPATLTLKWPNDVLRDDAKLGGILVDAAMTAEGGTDWLVIGVGGQSGDGAGDRGAPHSRPAADGRACGDSRRRRRLWHAPFLARIAAWRAVLAEDGFAPIRVGWLERAHPIGTPVTIKDSLRSREGLFAGLSPRGELLLSVGSQIHTISTGDVLLGQGG